MGSRTFAAAVKRDYSAEIQGTFDRVQRPLRWMMTEYGRRRISSPRFVGYRFSRVRGSASAGFAYGFALTPDEEMGLRAPPEAVTYAFVRPTDSDLYEELVTRGDSAVRRLAKSRRSLGYPFELHVDREIAALRHRSFARVPPELFVLGAADFFMLAQRPLRTGGYVRRVREATTRPGP